ncbi:MAG: ParB/RepB/Spo0J family partition protein, partial [Chloroflexi bacterium]|nr:ParB/RepB/Spo0J family partition protein [Chloroflexota bacterium]
ELAESIRQFGVLQPLLVTVEEAEADAARYRIIAGERRWRAAMQAGLATVPVIVREASSREALEIALIENLQRSDLTPLEEAGAFQRLIQEFGLTQETVAQRVSKSRPAVANALRLLRLAPAAQAALAGGEISAGHARALLAVEEPARMEEILAQVRRLGLNVRQTEDLVRQAARGGPVKPPRPVRLPEAERRFTRLLKSRVDVYRGVRGGRLVIHFSGEEQLDRLYAILAGSRSPDAPPSDFGRTGAPPDRSASGNEESGLKD